MKSKVVSTVPAIALIMAGSLGFAWADTSDVKLPGPVPPERVALWERPTALHPTADVESSIH